MLASHSHRKESGGTPPFAAESYACVDGGAPGTQNIKLRGARTSLLPCLVIPVHVYSSQLYAETIEGSLTLHHRIMYHGFVRLTCTHSLDDDVQCVRDTGSEHPTPVYCSIEVLTQC